MRRLFILAASAAVLLSGCAVGDQARDMTPAEKAAALQIAETAGFADPQFTSKRSDLFGGNYQESISFSVPSGTDDPYGPLVEPYTDVVSAYPGVELVPLPIGSEEGAVRCETSNDNLRWCAFAALVRISDNGEDVALLVRLTANSDQRVGMSVVPYYYDSAYPPYPAPPTIPDTYQGEAQ